MRSPRRLSRQVAAAFLLVTLIAWHVEAVAGQLRLTWLDNSTSELGFSVERSTGITGIFGEVGRTGPNVTAYTDLSVADATTYCYRARAFNSVAYSDYSNAACATTPQTLGLAVVKLGTGSGTVTSAPAGITCGATCAASYPSGTAVTLTAAPAAGVSFTGWSGGGCTGTGTCTVTVTAATTVTATFTLPSSTLTVGKAGTGSGTVTSAPAGITCGATCAASYLSGTAVTLTAAPAAGTTFTGWSGGGCAGTGTCTVTMSAATTVTATFAFSSRLPSFPLTVSRAGTGSGTVTSAPAGITCGATCAASYLWGTALTLTPAPAAGAAFTGWSGGGCAGTGTCTVTMSAATTVTATFMLQSVPVNRDFNGDGTADILWRHTSGTVAIWLMNGVSIATNVAVAGVPTNWTIAGVGDFNGDGKADILWRDTTSGTVAMWLMNGVSIASNLGVAVTPTSWTTQ